MRYERAVEVESAPMQDETILYQPVTVKFCTLNETAAFLWDRLEAPRSLGELIEDFAAEYAVEDISAAERDLDETLQELVGLKFVREDGAPGGNGATAGAEDGRGSSAYLPPRIRVMDEAEILQSFQITSAGISWWTM